MSLDHRHHSQGQLADLRSKGSANWRGEALIFQKFTLEEYYLSESIISEEYCFGKGVLIEKMQYYYKLQRKFSAINTKLLL